MRTRLDMMKALASTRNEVPLEEDTSSESPQSPPQGLLNTTSPVLSEQGAKTTPEKPDTYVKGTLGKKYVFPEVNEDSDTTDEENSVVSEAKAAEEKKEEDVNKDQGASMALIPKGRENDVISGLSRPKHTLYIFCPCANCVPITALGSRPLLNQGQPWGGVYATLKATNQEPYRPALTRKSSQESDSHPEVEEPAIKQSKK